MKVVRAEEMAQRLPALLMDVAAGIEVVVMEGETPIARLVPPGSGAKRTLGFARGMFVVPDDFDAPLPEEVLKSFEGKNRHQALPV